MPQRPPAPQMKRCPDCQAPNPQTRTTCYACGQGLDQVRLGTFAPDPVLRACPNCQTPVSIQQPFCQGCGREMTVAVPPKVLQEASVPRTDQRFGSVDTIPRARPAAQARIAQSSPTFAASPELYTGNSPIVVPEGWRVAQAPTPENSLLRIERTLRGRLNREMGTVAAVALTLIALVAGAFRRPLIRSSSGIYPILTYVGPAALIIGSIAALVVLARAFLYEESVTVGHGFVQVRRGWNRWQWQNSAQGQPGFIIVRTAGHGDGRGGSVLTWRVSAEAGGQSCLIERGATRLALMEAQLISPSVSGQAAEMARFLARHTGWPVVAPGLSVP